MPCVSPLPHGQITTLTANFLSWQTLSQSEDDTDQDDVPSDGALQSIPADICVVTTAEEARRVVKLLRTEYKHMTFACDTEVCLGTGSCLHAFVSPSTFCLLLSRLIIQFGDMHLILLSSCYTYLEVRHVHVHLHF